MRHSTPTPDAPQQIHLRLFAWIDSARGRVPERALWRETIDLAILTAEATAFVVHGRKIAAAVVHHLAWVIHSLTNSAGIAHASDDDLARHAHRDAKTVSRALIVLNRIHAVRSTRDSRRTKRFHAMNLGGLSWPAIRQRARLRRTVEAAYGGQQLPLPNYPSGGHTPPLRGVRTLGVKISDPIAVVDPPRGRDADQQKKQQQQPNTTINDNDKSHDERDEHRIKWPNRLPRRFKPPERRSVQRDRDPRRCPRGPHDGARPPGPGRPDPRRGTTRSAARRTTPSDATNGAPRPKVPGSRAPLRTPTRSPS